MTSPDQNYSHKLYLHTNCESKNFLMNCLLLTRPVIVKDTITTTINNILYSSLSEGLLCNHTCRSVVHRMVSWLVRPLVGLFVCPLVRPWSVFKYFRDSSLVFLILAPAFTRRGCVPYTCDYPCDTSVCPSVCPSLDILETTH